MNARAPLRPKCTTLVHHSQTFLKGNFLSMKTWVRKTLSVGVLAAGALLFAPGAAHADVSQNTWDNNGILNGTQFVVPISMPANIVGNSDAVLGHANAAGIGLNGTEGARKVKQQSHDNNGIANGTQVYLPIYAPLNHVGNADALLGHANAAGIGVNGGRGESTKTTEHGGPGQNSYDNNGILNGTQVYAPVDIPVNVCGNSFSLLGEANAGAVCANGGRWKIKGARGTEGVRQLSHDNNGIANGTQVYAPFTMPVNLAGNSGAALLGHSNAAGIGVNESGHGGGISQDTSDNNGIGNGTQIAAPIYLPSNVCGNALGILGHANAAGVCANGDLDGVRPSHHGHGNGHGNGHGDNGGDNGGVHGDDDDYLGDNGDDDDYLGDHGDNDGAGDAAGDDGYYGGGSDRKTSGKSATEGSAVDGLTQNLGQAGGTAIPGLDLLNTLR